MAAGANEVRSDKRWRAIEPGDRVVVVFGAGASISEMSRARSRAPLPPTDGNFLRVAEECCPKQVAQIWKTFAKLWQGGEAYPLHHQRMEQIFAGTYLKTRQTRGTTSEGRLARELYDELVILLRDTLYETTKKAVPTEHLDLLSRICAQEPASLDAISFNYDCLADRAMREGDARKLWRWSHQDGYGFKPSNQSSPRDRSTSKLFKLHGSMNWYMPLRSPRSRTVHDTKAPIYVPDPPASRAALAWQRRQRTLGQDKKREVFPLLVPPVFEKATQISGKLGSIWTAAQETLNAADVVVVWGYSLPTSDYHAEMLFAQAARRSRSRLLVVNPDKQALGRVTAVCGHQWSRWFFRAHHLLQAFDAEQTGTSR